jgi:hypothetical protein
MSRIRDLAKILTASTDMATDTEVTSSIASHAAAADPHTVYLKESEFNAAGKNLAINGGFDYWQRGTSLALTSGQVYLPDRFKATCRNGAGTQSRYSLTLSESAICANLKYAYQFDITTGATNTNPRIYHVLEDAFYYYGRTMTVSFYAKASKAITVGASADLIFNNADNTSSVLNASLTTSWQRFSYTFTLSPAGTYNSATDYGLILLWDTPMNDTYTVYMTGVQIENGSTMTPFSRAGGTLQGELAACQRYYYRVNSSTSPWTFFGNGLGYTTGELGIVLAHPVTMRSEAISIETSAMNTFLMEQHATSNTNTPSSIIIDTGASSINNTVLAVTKSASFTLGAIYRLLSNNSTSAYIGVNAEL